MRKTSLLVASAVLSTALLGILLVRFPIANHQTLAAALEAAMGMQNATSSPESAMGTSTAPSLVDVLQQLQIQNQLLASEVADLRTKAEEVHLKDVLPRTLKRGDSGDDVKTLQALLSGVSDAAATSTTGFYGGMTEKAVKDLQEQAGLKGTGVFDAQTRDALAASIQDQAAAASADVPIDVSSIADPQQTMQNLQDQISKLSSALSDTQATVADLQNQVTNLESEIAVMQNAVSQPLPATPTPQPLSISNIQVGTITKTSAAITWTTNNPSTSEVDYSQNSSMPVSQTLTVKDATMVTGHTATLSSLSSGVTYYYRIISEDNTNTIANSSNLTFTTLH
ncbi:peptidoglycan-binding protein [Patescibacteria group bacterium]|nr:peptidoglycan-binding protein [Patescibacteria group bacterium]